MCFKASNWHLKCLCGVALLQTDFPQEAFAVEIKMLMCSLSLSSVQESGDIGLQGTQQAEEKDGEYYVCSARLPSCDTNIVLV